MRLEILDRDGRVAVGYGLPPSTRLARAAELARPYFETHRIDPPLAGYRVLDAAGRVLAEEPRP